MSDDLTGLRERFEGEPYCRNLGIRVEAVVPEHARVRVPYRDENSNPGRALHGGVAASTIGIAGALAAWTGISEASGVEAGTLDLSVDYLAAAIGEDIVADAEVLRRGKELVYADVAVRNDAGKPIAKGLVTYRAAPATAPDRRRTMREVLAPDASEAVSDLARAFVSVPFIKRLGMRVAHVRDGTARMRLPFRAENADADGAVHEGALAAFVDTAGAMASWSLVGLELRHLAYKASTVGIHLNYHGRAETGEDVLAAAQNLTRIDEIFLNRVTVSGASSGRLVASGSVTYRILVPRP